AFLRSAAGRCLIYRNSASCQAVPACPLKRPRMATWRDPLIGQEAPAREPKRSSGSGLRPGPRDGSVGSSVYCMNDPPPEGHMASYIRRPKFLATLSGAAVSWPLAARAQQGEQMRRIGVLMNTAADDPTGQTRLLAFAQALAQADWTDGRNVRIDIRWGAGDPERIRKCAAELGALAPDVILASGTTTLGPRRQVSRTVPTVFTGVGDAVGAGFVDSLARPGGSATGFISFEWSISGKWLELLKEIAPGVTRAVVLRD